MKIYTAPMAGITDYSFRRILKKFSPDIMFTEMVNANLVNNQDDVTINKLLKRIDNESVQIFGAEKDSLIDAFLKLESFGINHLELNMGCPKQKIIKKGAGSALLPKKDYVTDILTDLKNKLKNKTELSIKIRIGYKEFNDSEFYLNLASKLDLKYICVHGRTKEQGYTGISNWDYVTKLSHMDRSTDFIGNGDIYDAQAIYNVSQGANLDGVLIARGMIGNPWLITQIREIFTDNKITTFPSFDDVIELLKLHYIYATEDKGEELAILEMRKFLPYYFKKYPEINIKNLIIEKDIKNIFYILNGYYKKND